MRPAPLLLAALSLLTSLLAIGCAGDFIADQNQSCTNSKLDKGETDVDCGGTGCSACEREKKCKLDSDCSAGLSCQADTRVAASTLRCQNSHCADNKRNDDETDIDCGGSCWPCKADQKCKTTADCNSQVCNAGLCAQASCTDKILNQDESDLDCGALLTTCPGCAAGKTCVVDGNCDSGVCDSGTCAQATCNDSRHNGDEGGIDCGGSCPTKCGQASSCNKDTDCTSGVCRGNQCLSADCADGVRNGTESDVDCGGSCGATCVDTAGCNTDSDCIHSFCNAHICQMPTCNDGVKNQRESDIDCGDLYGLCVPCVTGQSCIAGAGCVSGNCDLTDKRCVAATCTDLIKNQYEGDVDCGGECVTQKCPTGSTCRVPSDCVEGVCTEGRCLAAVCPDGVKNGLETDKDCGGPTSGCSIRCGIGLACKANSDCANNSCFGGMCQDPSCANLIQDGAETDVDCGGASCAKCIANKKCAKDDDCLSLNCDEAGTRLCIADSCFDGIKNGSEAAADCGGSCAKKCIVDQPCLAATDCVDGVCNPTTKLCTAATCADGVKNGLETDQDCGGALCLAPTTPKTCELNQGCLDDTDCNKTRNLICDAATGKCVKWNCNDQRKNQDESDVDCGGTTSGCVRCPTGKTCGVEGDCKDLKCVTGKCAAPRCDDEVKNGDEGDVDCGGSICTNRCVDTKFCNVGSDCVAGVCSATTPQVCLKASCTDKVKNGDETDIDCGGSCSTKCADGKQCTVVADCINPLSKCSLSGSANVCTPPGCGDSTKNGSETDIDCGGGCPGCAITKKCLVDNDCALPASGKCSSQKICVAATCGDLVQNGAESDADCGGSPSGGAYPICDRCVTGKKCSVSSDCTSKSCSNPLNGTCLAPTCSDGILNGGEIATDCGSACASVGKLCDDGTTCNSDADCKNGWCQAGTSGKACATPTCSDGVLNGFESDKDCGAICVTKLCALGAGCKKDADCSTNTCSECTGKCIYPKDQCLAQGSGCAQCTDTQACSENFDCKSLNCDAATTKKCLAPVGCAGKVLDGAGCSDRCKQILRCLFAYSCAYGAPCATASGVCGSNTFNFDMTPYNEAEAALKAVCPSGGY